MKQIITKHAFAFILSVALFPLSAFCSTTEAFKTNEINTIEGKALNGLDYDVNACAKGTKIMGARKTRTIIAAGPSVMNDYEKAQFFFYPGSTYLGASIYRAEIISGDGTGEFTLSLVNPPADFITKYQKAIGKTKWKKLIDLPRDFSTANFTDADAATTNIFQEDKGEEDLFPRLIIEANTDEITKNKYVILRCQVEY